MIQKYHPNLLRVYSFDEIRYEYKTLGINNNAINTLIQNKELNDYLSSIIKEANPVLLANMLTGDILGYLNKNFVKLENIKLTKEEFIKIVNKIDKNEITKNQSKDILNYILENGGNLDDVLKKLDIKQMDNENELIEIVTNVLKNNTESVNDYKNGKERAIKYLMGQIMKEAKGNANPVKVNEILMKELSKY